MGELLPGLPDCFMFRIPKQEKIYQMAIKYTNWPQNRPNGNIIYQRLPLQDPPKFTQIVFWGV
jgi:hypothetical protein